MFVSKKLGRFFAAMCLLVLTAGSAWAQSLNVTGKVVDKNNEPIIGAYVVVAGTTTGTSTNVDGGYSINVPANGTLQFTCIGYKTQEVAVAGRKVIDIILADDAEMLENAVVVGYGTQKLANLTGSVATVDATKALESRPIADVGRGLQGMAPGLNVRITSSEVGAEPVLRIRGQFASFQGSAAPLILLDNVEIDSIQLLNPDDIESISVLKDAASASIYGAKAAFGVVLITSKKGAREKDNVHITYSGNIAFQNLAEPLAIAGVNGMHYTVQAFERTGGTVAGYPWYVNRQSYLAAVEWDKQFGSFIGADDPVVYGRDYYYDGSRVYGIRTYNPTDYLIRKNAPVTLHNVSVAGNKGRTDYNLSTSFMDQVGQTKHAKHDDYQRWNLNARVNTQITKWLNAHAGLMFSKTQKRMAYNTAIGNADYWYYLYRWSPMQTIALEDSNGYSLRSPAQEARDANTAVFSTMYTSGNLGLTITPIKNWNINADYTYAATVSDSYRPGTRFTAGDTWSTPSPIGGEVKNYWNQYNGMGDMIPNLAFVPIQITSAGSGIDHVHESYGLAQRRTLNATTDYTLDLRNHNLKFLLGMNMVDYRYKDFWTRKTNLLDITNPQIALATGTITNGGDETWSSTLGFFGRINYNYKEKYLIEANLRYDGSSKFPKQLKWMWFPSVSAGWRVTEEPWMQGAKDVLSSLKLRASWGTIGDQSVAGSMYIPTMGSTLSTWIHGSARDTYFNTAGAIASDITWQMIETIDFGADIALFNSLNLTFDWFRRKTNGMIVPGPGVGYAYGTTAPQGNFGSLRTDGWELSINYGHMFDNGFSLSATATLADAVTTITKYGSSQSVDDWYVGRRYGDIWGYRVDRLYQNDDFVWENGSLVRVEANDPSNPSNYQYAHYKMKDGNAPLQGRFNASNSVMFGPGDVKYKDLNGDGIIDDGKRLLDDHGDLDIIGNTTPRYEYSFRVDLAWKGFDFSMFWQGIGKRDMWGSSSLTLPGFNSSDGAMAAAFADDFWYEEFDASGNLIDANYNAFYPRAYNMGNSTTGFNLQTNDRYLLNMAYLRLKNLTFGYSLPAKVINKIGMQRARFYISLENFLTFDHLKGMPVDPEVVAGTSSLLSSDYNSSRAAVGAPAMRTASFGVQISF